MHELAYIGKLAKSKYFALLRKALISNTLCDVRIVGTCIMQATKASVERGVMR